MRMNTARTSFNLPDENKASQYHIGKLTDMV
jgi:hypothetical protein